MPGAYVDVKRVDCAVDGQAVPDPVGADEDGNCYTVSGDRQ